MISAIIAAYNEEKTLAEVLGVLTKSGLIDEIIVVSDGSTDRTAKVMSLEWSDVLSLGIEVIECVQGFVTNIVECFTMKGVCAGASTDIYH